MSENRLEKSEMSSVEFSSTALKRYVAPKGAGQNVKDRIRVAARKLGWSFSRTKDVWYADPFRLIPEGLRHGSILIAMPVMAAQKRLMGALTHSLRAVKQSR